MKARACTILAVAAACLALSHPAAADVEGFYKGKTLRIQIGSSPGAGFDAFGRTVARHMGNYLPGKPTIIASNMPGAGSMRAVQSLRAEAKDGTYIVHFNPGQIIYTMVNPKEFDNFKFTDVAFVGSATADVRVCWAWHTTGVKTVDDLLKRDQFATGHTGIGAATYLDAAILKNLFGAKLKQVVGYPGATEQRIAVERGELDGDCGTWESVPPDWMREGKANVFVRISKATAHDVPNVPHVGDLANAEQKQVLDLVIAHHDIFRPFIVSGEVPPDRIKALRDAFWQMLQDKPFQEEAQRIGRDLVNPMRGEDVHKLIDRLYSAPPEVVAKAALAIK
jgi:tripartite-type tricarboxylate transporter receptor subunit TctC